MHHFKAAATGANIAKSTHPGASDELRLLLSRKIEIPQRDLARSVADTYQKAAPTAKNGLSEQHLTFHETSIASFKRTDRDEIAAVFVAQRKQEKQVFNAVKIEALKFRSESGPDAFQRRQGGSQIRFVVLHRLSQSPRTASASISVPFGSDATPTAARAG